MARPARRRRRAWAGLLTASLWGLSGCSHLLPASLRGAAETSTGFAAHLLCNDHLVSGLPVEQALAERLGAMRPAGHLLWALDHQVDRSASTVRVRLAGGFERVATWSPSLGCQVAPATALHGPQRPHALAPVWPERVLQEQAQARQPATEATTPPWPMAPVAAVQAVLARHLPDQAPHPARVNRALVVVHQGRLVAEAYAPGIGPDTPLLGFSATKSALNLLVGALVHQGRLRVDQAVAAPEWSAQGDARQAITVAQLLRQTSGLHLPQTNSAFDFNARTLYTVADKAAAFAQVPLVHAPGSRWQYSDGHYLLLGRLLRDLAWQEGPASVPRTDAPAQGGAASPARHHPGTAWTQLVQSALFGPLGLTTARWDLDAAGTPLASSHLLASARDWARLGQLALDDGVAHGRRLLPAGWVAWSTQPTLDTGYGAGWWTNRLPGPVLGWGAPWGLPQAPADTFFARGFMGQFVVVVPSERLVLVRLGAAPLHGDDIGHTDALLADVRAALRPPRP